LIFEVEGYIRKNKKAPRGNPESLGAFTLDPSGKPIS
jgi:hypothetical protein